LLRPVTPTADQLTAVQEDPSTRTIVDEVDCEVDPQDDVRATLGEAK
jgi:hypothetical protein